MTNEATTFANLVDPAQLVLIRRAARVVKVDHDEECQKVMGCRTEDLSRTAADTFLHHLWTLKEKVA